MESKDGSADVAVDNTTSVEVKENDHNDSSAAEESSPKKTKMEENTPTEKKQRRSSGRKNRCDIDIMEEARAAYGELDASEGRRLRKRPEPPKVEKTPPTQKRRSGSTPGGKKKVGDKHKAEDESGENLEETKTEKATEIPADAPAENDDVTSDKGEEKKEAVERSVEDEQKCDLDGEKVAAEPSASSSATNTVTPAVESDTKVAEPQNDDEAKKDTSE